MKIAIKAIFISSAIFIVLSQKGVQNMNTWHDTISLADQIKNTINGRFINPERNDFQFENLNAVLTHNLQSPLDKNVTSLKNNDGGIYLENTMDLYVTTPNSKMYTSQSKFSGRMNEYRLGYYYYDFHIADLGFVNQNPSVEDKILKRDIYYMRAEKIFHTYPDKIHEEMRFVAMQNLTDLTEYGLEVKIPKSTVSSLLTDKSYVAFDIKNAGILGFILPLNEDNGELVLSDNGANYILTHKVAVNGEIADGQVLALGNRLYTDKNHTFDAFLHEVYIEQNPLNAQIIKERDNAVSLGYNGIKGAYSFEIDGADFNAPYFNIPNYHFKLNALIEGDSLERDIYIYSHGRSGCLECAAVLDENENLLPIPVEVCKNFCGEFEEKIFDPADTQYGDSIFPLHINENESKEFTLLNIYQNWGIFPLKQLSSIQFISPYYHLSLGVTETNCIAPYFVFGKDAWVLPDFRALSSVLWDSQPQHFSVGRLYFLQYKDIDGNQNKSESQSAYINSSGPVYADIDTEYLSDDGKIKATYRHLELPQTDETRTFYTIRLDFIDDLTIDVKNDFSVFSFDGRFTKFAKTGYLDKNNNMQVKNSVFEEGFSELIELGGNAPYFDYFTALDTKEIVNFGLIVKNYDIVIGGEKYKGNLMFRNSFKDKLNLGALTLNLNQTTFKKGDYIEINLILLPFGDPDIDNDNSVRLVREDSILKPVRLDVITGALVNDAFLSSVRAVNNTAEFIISGGKNNTVVKAEGLKSYKRPKIYEKINGAYIEYKTDINGYDGIQAISDNGIYSFAFAVNMNNGSRTFKIVQ